MDEHLPEHAQRITVVCFSPLKKDYKQDLISQRLMILTDCSHLTSRDISSLTNELSP